MAKATDGNGTPVPQRLLAAATRLFAERGYERTSVQEIVEAAGVTKGALYHYFGSKEDLLQEVYARVLRLQQERLDAYADSAEPIEQHLVLAELYGDRVHHLLESISSSRFASNEGFSLTPSLA